MDDVLSKPLAVPALTAMIKKFWDTCDEEESTMTSVDSAKAQTILDTAMLEQYIDLVGPKLITDGLAVFEKMMPGYLNVLESNLTAAEICLSASVRARSGNNTTGRVSTQ